MSPYRRQMVQETRRKGGKGGKGNWRERWKPNEQPEAVVLIPGEYREVIYGNDGVAVEATLPWHKYGRHTRKFAGNKIRTTSCSAGPNPHAPQQCVGCQLEQTGDRSIKLSDAYAVGLYHLKPYHGHPILDAQTNQYLIKKDGPEAGKYVIGYDECEGRNCNFCRALAGQQPVLQPGETFPYWPKDITTVFGHRRYLEMGRNGLDDLKGWDLSIMSTCFSQGYLRHPQTGQYILDQQSQQPIPSGICGNQLTTVSWNCVYCNSVLIDMATDQRDDKQIAEALGQLIPCQRCQRGVDVQEVVTCDVCNKPTQLNVFSGAMVLWLKKTGQDTSTHMVLDKFEPLDLAQVSLTRNYGGYFPDGNGGTKLFTDRDLKKLLEDSAKPYDFEELLRPLDLQKQAKILEVNIASQGGPPAYGAGPQYGSPPGGPPPSHVQPPQGPQFGPPGTTGGPPGSHYSQPGQPTGGPPQFQAPPVAGPSFQQPPGPGAGPVAGTPYMPPGRPNFQQ